MATESKGVVLIVDDESFNLSVLNLHLQNAGYKVLVAEDGESALSRIGHVIPDIILLDISMSGMDGFETCRNLKENETYRDIPVLFMTVATETADKVRAFETGAVDFISKPFDEPEMLARIETHLTIRRMRKELEAKNVELEKKIAERNRAEEHIRRQNEHMRLAQEMAKMGYWTFDIATQMAEWSDMMFAILGCDPEEGPPSYKAYRNFIHPEDWDGFDKAVRAAVEGAPFFLELRIIFPDNGIHFVIAQGYPRFNPDGTIASLFGTAQDISKQKKADEQIRAQAEKLENQNVLLEQAVKKKEREMEALFEKYLLQEKLATIGKVTGSIAHELRNPLGAVKQSVYYLNRLARQGRLDVANPKVNEHLGLIGREIDVSERVLTDVLQIARVTVLQKAKTDLGDLIESALTHCRIPENVRIQIDLEPRPFMVLADSGQMRQVLINLLTNALQATDGGGKISIRARQPDDGNKALIEISDTGVGIGTGNLKKIFEPLYTTKARGTGLGLCVCKQIVDNHGGRITITSEPGNGTTVSVSLPGR